METSSVATYDWTGRLVHASGDQIELATKPLKCHVRSILLKPRLSLSFKPTELDISSRNCRRLVTYGLISVIREVKGVRIVAIMQGTLVLSVAVANHGPFEMHALNALAYTEPSSYINIFRAIKC
jgi:hypothetical protein